MVPLLMLFALNNAAALNNRNESNFSSDPKLKIYSIMNEDITGGQVIPPIKIQANRLFYRKPIKGGVILIRTPSRIFAIHDALY